MSERGDGVLIFTATYNERENIVDLIGAIKKHVPDADILVVDDHSPDGTGDLLDELAGRISGLHVIHREGKLGVGSAHRLAFTYARERGYGSLVTLDADFSHDPAVIPEMLKLMGRCDYVVGSRFVAGGSLDYTGFRRLVSVGANFLARGLLGIKCRETTTSFRCFSRRLLESFDINVVKSEGYSFFLECTFYVCRVTDKICELPIQFVDRRHGESKISKKEILRGFLTLFRLAFFRCLYLCGPQKSNQNLGE